MRVIQVTLTESEQAIVRYIARKRFDANQNRENGNPDATELLDKFSTLNGFGGEVAFCKAFNIFPNFDTAPTWGENYLGNILPYGQLSNGKRVADQRVDVRTSTDKNATLIEHDVRPEFDLFVLVKGKFPIYDIVGFMKREELEKTRNIARGFGSVHYNYLYDMSSVVDDLILPGVNPLSSGESAELNQSFVDPFDHYDVQISNQELNDHMPSGCYIIDIWIEGVHYNRRSQSSEALNVDEEEEAWSIADYAEYLGWEENSGITPGDWAETFEPDYD